ncbi:unnamed protein product [Oppiella nova]|uniref:GH18 domain-containing protein n=1 Tax=Oppiella nova TaxID=334625 RepID=A0A7R9LZJ6_9ACAR|nr:unnamed protein product [Oppiella nova]CAG2168417.1 unnamed protein product [Oppiella nova]
MALSKDDSTKDYRIVGYWSSWSYYRTGNGKFTEANFEPKMYKHFNDLRQRNPHLKTLVAIGGWNEGSTKYSQMANNPGARKIFVDSVVKEYPAERGGQDQDKQAFIDLLHELHTAFQPHGYLLTAAVSAGKAIVDRAYNVPEMNKYLDFINVMTYDMHGSWEQKTGHNAPLHAGEGDDKTLTVEYAINYWLGLGAHPNKLVLGLPFYGRTFTLASPQNNGFNAPTTGPGSPGPYTKESGFIGYNEICENKGWDVKWDDKRKATYAVMGSDWVGYDNEQSIKAKVEFIKSKGLGGAMVWAIETDDFRGVCGSQKYPLLNAINQGLKGMFKHFTDLRQKNPHLITLVAIGGWGEGSDKYSQMANDPGARKTFVDSVVKFVGQHAFNGLDVDWEYPAMSAVGNGVRKNADKQAFIDLLRELHTAFQPHGYLLTAAVSAGKAIVDRAYNVSEMNKYLDFINVMTYNMHNSWKNKTGHNAPLHAGEGDDEKRTVEYITNYWLGLGAQPKKLVLGIRFYGRTFTLASNQSNGFNAPTTGPGSPGPYTKKSGVLSYNEICENKGWDVKWDDQRKAPYAIKGNDWVSYDNEQSIKAKVEFIKSKGLGGAMVWAIEADDFNGVCGSEKYPLINAINNGLNG